MISKTQQIDPYLEYYWLLLDKQAELKSLQQFANGTNIANVISKIKQFPVMKIEQNPSTFAHSFANLKQLYKKVQQFWNQILDKQIDCQEIDLVQIAHHQNVKQVAKLLNLIIQTFFLSSQRQYFVSKILEASSATQKYFMSIVQSTLEKRKTFSPRKQKEQRLYDKMIELDHQNENLQNFITQICKQKQEIDNLYKQAQGKLLTKQMQIKKLNETLADYTQTPLKKKQQNSYQSQEKNAELAQKLKQKILQMSKQHENQILALKQQVDFFSQKAQASAHLENEVEIYKVKIQANSQAIQQYTQLSRKYAEAKLNMIEKQQMANEYSRKLNAKTTRLQQIQEKLLQTELQLQRKNIIVQQLKLNKNNKSHYFDDLPSLNSLSLQRTLSQHCPEVANSQAQFLYQSNKKLREQLQRATTTIRQRQCQLDKLKKQNEKRENFEIQNKKLVAVIQQIKQQHDQQKSLILGCLHEVRLKTINELAPRQRAKRQQIKANLKTQSSKIISSRGGYLKRSQY